MPQDLLAMARGDDHAAAGGGSDLFEMACFKPQPKKPAERTWGEAATDTVVQLAEGVNNIAGAVPHLFAPQSSVAAFFRDNADHWRGKQSEAMRRKVADADAQIAQANQDFIVDQAVAAAKAYGTPAEDMLPDSPLDQPARRPGPAADTADTAAAVTRLAELEVIDGSVGLSAEQKAERAVLAERVERAAAREEELEAIGETPEEAAGAAARSHACGCSSPVRRSRRFGIAPGRQPAEGTAGCRTALERRHAAQRSGAAGPAGGRRHAGPCAALRGARSR
ncbi:hypothetical protein I4I83_12995, partial [Acidovorax cattleyae]|nr:hypothetical protein [Paracidovorax cattleyae]